MLTKKTNNTEVEIKRHIKTFYENILSQEFINRNLLYLP